MNGLLEAQHVEIAQLLSLSVEQRLMVAGDHTTSAVALRVLVLDMNPAVRQQAMNQLADRKGHQL